MPGTPPPSPNGDAGKDKATAAAGDLVDPSASTNLQQAEIAARLAKERASAAALERQKTYDAAVARLAEAEEEAAKAASARDADLVRRSGAGGHQGCSRRPRSLAP